MSYRPVRTINTSSKTKDRKIRGAEFMLGNVLAERSGKRYSSFVIVTNNFLSTTVPTSGPGCCLFELLPERILPERIFLVRGTL
jgi:hypothetical protein